MRRRESTAPRSHQGSCAQPRSIRLLWGSLAATAPAAPMARPMRKAAPSSAPRPSNHRPAALVERVLTQAAPSLRRAKARPHPHGSGREPLSQTTKSYDGARLGAVHACSAAVLRPRGLVCVSWDMLAAAHRLATLTQRSAASRLRSRACIGAPVRPPSYWNAASARARCRRPRRSTHSRSTFRPCARRAGTPRLRVHAARR